MRVVLRLRCLQYHRMLHRWIRKLTGLRCITLVYLVVILAGAAWVYATLPDTLSRAIEASAYPVTAAAEGTGLFLLLIVTFRQLTRGIQYPPMYLARGDILLLLTGPLPRRMVLAMRLGRTCVWTGVSWGALMLFLSPFLIRIWPDLSAPSWVLIWLHLWLGLVVLINWRWEVFHARRLRQVARAIRLVGYVLVALVLATLFVIWVIGPIQASVDPSDVVSTMPLSFSSPWWGGPIAPSSLHAGDCLQRLCVPLVGAREPRRSCSVQPVRQ